MRLSRFPVGSSASSIDGLVTNARATATRWRCRPTARSACGRGDEPGRRAPAPLARSPLLRRNPGIEGAAAPRCVASRRAAADGTSGTRNRSPGCEPAPAPVWRDRTRAGRRAGIRRRLASRQPRMFMSVVLPEPEGPMIASTHRARPRSSPRRGRTVSPPMTYSRARSWIAMTGAALPGVGWFMTLSLPPAGRRASWCGRPSRRPGSSWCRPARRLAGSSSR